MKHLRLIVEFISTYSILVLEGNRRANEQHYSWKNSFNRKNVARREMPLHFMDESRKMSSKKNEKKKPLSFISIK